MLDGHLAEARQHCEIALKCKPGFELAEHNLAMVLVKSDNSSGALPHFKAAAEINPSRFENFNELGICYGLLGQMDNAERAFVQAERLNPTDSRVQANLAKARAQLNATTNVNKPPGSKQ
jgi:tetratricopeptide (TPR) repeat protein